MKKCISVWESTNVMMAAFLAAPQKGLLFIANFLKTFLWELQQGVLDRDQ